jgi:hypothetical protein
MDAARWILACAAATSVCAHAADVGGFFSDQLKPPAASGPNECAQAIRQAAADTTAINAYRAALCYLHAETPDPLAAMAWLQRSADMKFLPADRLLRSLQVAQAGPHSTSAHCHDLGEGRQICHGGTPVALGSPAAAAAAATPAPAPAPAPKN